MARSARSGKITINEDSDLDSDTKISFAEDNGESGDSGDDTEGLGYGAKKKMSEDVDQDSDTLLNEEDSLDEEEADEGFDPNLDAGGENRRLKLLPEDDDSDDEIVKRLHKKDKKDKDDDKKNESKDVEGISIQETLTKLFDGENFTEEFRTKVASLFEVAVNNKARTEVELLERNCVEVIKEQREKTKTKITEAVDRLMTHFSKVWFNENRIDIVDQVTMQLAEGALKATKTFLSQFNVRVPKSRENLVEKLSLSNSGLQKKLDEALEREIKLQESLDEIHKKDAIQAISEGLSDTDKERFKVVAEDVTYTDEKSYRIKLKSIRESAFNKTSSEKSAEDFASKMLMEKSGDAPKVGSSNGEVPTGERYLSLMR